MTGTAAEGDQEVRRLHSRARDADHANMTRHCRFRVSITYVRNPDLARHAAGQLRQIVLAVTAAHAACHVCWSMYSEPKRSQIARSIEGHKSSHSSCVSFAKAMRLGTRHWNFPTCITS